MDSFSKTTLTRSSTVWNCTRIFSFRVFKGRDEGDICNCGYSLPQKLVSMWFLVMISVLVLVPCSYGNTLPIASPAHYSNNWSPKQDSVSNSYNNYNAPNYKSASVVSIPTYPVRRQQYIHPFQDANNDQTQPQQRVHTTIPEPKPRHDELKEKLGFSLPSLSSLLPTSILNMPQQEASDSENQIETDGNNNNNDSPFLDESEFRQNPPRIPGPGDDNPAFAPEDQQNFEENDQSDSDSSASNSGLLSRIRNVLPFGNGFISGLLTNPDSNVEGEGNGDSNINNDAGDGDMINQNNFNSGVPNDSSPPDPNQVSITNEGDLDSQSSESEDASQTLPNPLRAMLNLLNLRPPALSDNKQSLDLPDLGSTNPLSQLGGDDGGAGGDSPITALQSLAEGGVGGVVGTAMSLFSTVATTIGITGTNATWFILLGLALGPMIATAIAASVIAIVYASVYIPAAAIRNEDLDGEFYLLTMKRLLEILGLPDPIEELFGKRSYDGRSLLLQDHPSPKKALLLAGTVHNQRDECLERAFCEVIGRKLMGKKERQKGWVGKGIKWLLEKLQNNNFSSFRSYSSFRIGIPFLEAISTGISSSSSTTPSRPKRSSLSESNTTKDDGDDGSVSDSSSQNTSSCMKYICDPIKSLQALIIKKRNKVPDPKADVVNQAKLTENLMKH